MANADTANGGNGVKSFWLTAVQTVGISTAACIALAWFINATITWEREQMIPALHDSKSVIQGNTEVLKNVKTTLDDLKIQLPGAQRQRNPAESP